jgi:hypothetical protein
MSPALRVRFFVFAEVDVRVHGLLSTGVARVVESHGMSNLMRRHVREVECVGRATNDPIPVIAVDLVELDDGSATAAPDIGYGDRAAAPAFPKAMALTPSRVVLGRAPAELPEPRICRPAATSHRVIAASISVSMVVALKGDPVALTDHGS